MAEHAFTVTPQTSIDDVIEHAVNLGVILTDLRSADGGVTWVVTTGGEGFDAETVAHLGLT